MSNKIESSLRFKKYIVKEANFKINEQFTEREVDIVFNVASNISIEGNNLNVELVSKIFNDAKNNDYPFEMNVVIVGNFEADNDIEKFVPNAIAILYPYVRAIVSTYTAQANVNPLILPAININKMIKNNR